MRHLALRVKVVQGLAIVLATFHLADQIKIVAADTIQPRHVQHPFLDSVITSVTKAIPERTYPQTNDNDREYRDDEQLHGSRLLAHPSASLRSPGRCTATAAIESTR